MTKRQPRLRLYVTPQQAELLTEALDSHEYWQLSDAHYRSDASVDLPGSDDEDKHREIVQARVLGRRISEEIQGHRPVTSDVERAAIHLIANTDVDGDTATVDTASFNRLCDALRKAGVWQ